MTTAFERINPDNYLPTSETACYGDDVSNRLFYWNGRLVQAYRKNGNSGQISVRDPNTLCHMGNPTAGNLYVVCRKSPDKSYATQADFARMETKIDTAAGLLQNVLSQQTPHSAPQVSNIPQTDEPTHEEYQYLDILRNVIAKGESRSDRTGVGTLGLFGCTMRFDLSKTFPLLTTKRVFWRGVVEELLWFISGDTNANHLKEKKVGIWNENGSKVFLESVGLGERDEGDLGPVYGFQWRHFGAKYVDMYTDYSGQGVDQLAECIHKIKTNPTDRRIIMSAWNPCDLALMALPPCHMFCQFYVSSSGRLSCLMYQRSCDMGLGVPFNIASYALLTRMIAQVCDLEPGEFIHMMGDTHVYINHVEPLKEQLVREPRTFPTLKINPEKKDIGSFTFEDFSLEGYDPHPSIKMELAV